jgi:hypothetical protein
LLGINNVPQKEVIFEAKQDGGRGGLSGQVRPALKTGDDSDTLLGGSRQEEWERERENEKANNEKAA